MSNPAQKSRFAGEMVTGLAFYEQQLVNVLPFSGLRCKAALKSADAASAIGQTGHPVR